MTVIGLDIHSRHFTMAITDRQGNLRRRPVTTSTSEKNLVRETQKIKGEKVVVLEECELAQWVKGILEDRVDKLVICDPKQNAWIAKAEFNDDETSARKLSHLYQGGFTKEIKHPDAAGAALRSLFVHYVDMTTQMTRFKSKLKSCFRRVGIVPEGTAIYKEDAEKTWLKKLDGHAHLECRARHCYQALRMFEKCRGQTAAKLKRCKRPKETYRLLQTLPGVGPVVALGYLAIIGTPHRFSRRSQLWRYSTLGNIHRESDGRLYNRKPSRSGNRVLKWLIFRQFKGVLQQKRPCRFKRMYERLQRRGLPKKQARRQVCRRLMSTNRAVWQKGEAYRA